MDPAFFMISSHIVQRPLRDMDSLKPALVHPEREECFFRLPGEDTDANGRRRANLSAFFTIDWIHRKGKNTNRLDINPMPPPRQTVINVYAFLQ